MNEKNKLGPFLAILKAFMDALENVGEVSLAKEVKAIFDGVTYTRFSPKNRKHYINVIPCKFDILLCVLDGNSVNNLNEKYDRTWVWRCKNALISSGILIKEGDGSLNFPPKKFPGLFFIQIIKELNKLSNPNKQPTLPISVPREF